MGTFIKTDLNRVAKTIEFLTIGAPVLLVKGYSKGLETYAPGFTEQLDKSGHVEMVSGSAVVYDYVADAVVGAFKGSSVFLTKDEIAAIEVQALETSDQTGQDYQVIYDAMIAMALSVKEAQTKSK